MSTRGDGKRKTDWLLAVLVLLVAVVGVAYLSQPYWPKAPVLEPVVAERSIGPAPTLQKVPAKTVKGKKMPEAWRTIGTQPGDPTCRGTFVEDGTHYGKKCFVLHKGTANERWLWWNDPAGRWTISYEWDDTGIVAYIGTEVDLPGNPWLVAGGPEMQPEPTLAPVLPVVRPKHGLLYRSGPHLKGVT